MRGRVKSIVKVAIAFALVAFSCTFLSACKETDVIVERIWEETSPNVDYDNPQKNYVPDESSPTTAKDLNLRREDVPNLDKILRDAPSKKGSSDKKKISKRSYNSEKRNQLSAPSQGGASTGTGGETSGSSSSKSSGKGSSGKKKAGSGGSKGSNGKGPSDDSGSGTGQNKVDLDDHNDGDDRIHDVSYGNTEDLPTDVSSIVAPGELATMALSLGNSGVLKGSSKEYLDQRSVSDVFSSKDVAKAKKLWKSDEGALSDSEVEAIIAARPKACLFYSGQLSAKQEKKIVGASKETVLVVLSRPTSEKNIKADMRAIATLLDEETDGKALEKYRSYLEFVDEVVQLAKDAHGGGVATYDSVDYNAGSESSPVKTSDLMGKDPKWTLYISGWDKDARVSASYSGAEVFTDTGAAYTNIGWSWSPISYYMSVGGVINNAAAYGPLSTSTVQPVLEFNENQVSYKWSNFCVQTDDKNGGGSFSRYKSFHVLFNARDGADTQQISDAHPLGSDDFKTVVVASKSIASALREARKKSDGLYTMYPSVSTGNISGFGRLFEKSNKSVILWTTVLSDKGYDIEVNPCGYVGSWANGSMESPLEALWVAWRFYGLDKSKLEEKIVDFYDSFYGGYSPDVDKIISGSYAE